jgi:hypothetical protein
MEQEPKLAIAGRRVTEGRRIVAQQRERIARLKALGCSTLDHEQTLTVFLSTLSILEDHERMLRDRFNGSNRKGHDGRSKVSIAPLDAAEE